MTIQQLINNESHFDNITPELVASTSKKKFSPKSSKGLHYWLETFPEENGRTSIISINNQKEITNITGIT